MVQVGCAGILVADTFAGPMKSLPGPGQLVAIDGLPATVGGCASNVACDLSKQGIAAGVVGCVGNDLGAQIVIDALEARGVDCQQVRTSSEFPTSQTLILLVQGQDRRFIHVFGANGNFAVEQIDRQWLAGLDALYVGGLLAMPSFRLVEFAKLLQFCRASKVLTVVDVVVSEDMNQFDGLDECLPYIDFFMPNDVEAAKITQQIDPLDQAKCFCDKGVVTTVITLGEQGALAMRDGKGWRIPAFDVNAVDGTGCGDAFDAGLIVATLQGWDFTRVLSYASALGGSCAQAIGCYDGVFTPEQADLFLATHQLEIEEFTV